MTNTTDPFAEWYNAPLSVDDWIAGGSLILLTLFFVPFYAVVGYILFKADKEIIGFRYLVSAAFSDILVMLQYGLLDGLCIVLKSPPTAVASRGALQVYIDWVWFAMCMHYPLIAWSRLVAIQFPYYFRGQSRGVSYAICTLPYILSAVQVAATHWQSFYVTFYFEPAMYGMLAEEFPKYLAAGQSQMFLAFHCICVIIPFFFYGYTILLLLKHSKFLGQSSTPMARPSRWMSVETKLILPCVLGTVVFVIGQVAITIGTGKRGKWGIGKRSGKWATWLICFLFFLNGAVNSVLLVLFSPFLRFLCLHPVHLKTPIEIGSSAGFGRNLHRSSK